jgi:hypothetical protein
MVCMSQRIQKKSRKRGKESDRKEEKGEKGDTAHGMSHKKKAELTCCFFLSRSLRIFIASRSRNSSTATHLHTSSSPCYFFFFKKKIYISNADDSSLNYSFIELIDVKKPTIKFDDLCGFFCDYSR